MSYQITPIDTLNRAENILLLSLSESSKRQYTHTFNRWVAYCDAMNYPHSNLSSQTVYDFLYFDDISFSTRKTRLSHIRNLVKYLYALSPDNSQLKSLYAQLQLLSPKPTKQEQLETQTKHALTEQQIESVFATYPDDTMTHKRNRAILAILFYAGLRRSEAATLKWTDFDFENSLLTVRHGKGNKTRTIPMLDGWQYIDDWYQSTKDRDFCFFRFYKGGKLGKDKPVSPQSIYLIVKDVAKALDIKSLSPHDARRTIITNLLNKGVAISDVQHLAGHSHSSTTGDYAVIRNAKEVANRINKILSD